MRVIVATIGWLALVPDAALADWGLSSDPAQLGAAAAVVAAYLGFCGLIAVRHRGKDRRRRQAAAAMLTPVGVSNDTRPGEARVQPVLVAFASQSGVAEQLAWQTARSLQEAEHPVRIAALDEVDADTLRATTQALFVVSTTGEGDAPDNAAAFTRRVMAEPLSLPHLRFGVLALGDRSYANFCAFGRTLDGWLREHAAKRLFDTVEVDDSDAAALRQWRDHVAALGGRNDAADWSAPRYETWRLVERCLLNAGSPGGAAFHVALEPPTNGAVWSAGDVAEIGPRHPPERVETLLDTLGLSGTEEIPTPDGARTLHDVLSGRALPDEQAAVDALRGLSGRQLAERFEPMPHRSYSIASLPQDGRIELLVRLMQHPDGRPGVGSGWLSTAPIGSAIDVRVRVNRSFHPPESGRPLILIGNGTGLAGLRAHLKARIAGGHGRNWLLFGERKAEHDFFYRSEIEAWRDAGTLARIDLAFSRDQDKRIYVQDHLRSAADELRRWVDDGAAVYVCGSLQGMASGVAAVLSEVLGEDKLAEMREARLYCRDVY